MSVLQTNRYQRYRQAPRGPHAKVTIKRLFG